MTEKGRGEYSGFKVEMEIGERMSSLLSLFVFVFTS